MLLDSIRKTYAQQHAPIILPRKHIRISILCRLRRAFAVVQRFFVYAAWKVLGSYMDLTGIIGLSITRAYARDISGHALLHSCRVSFLADRWRSSTLGSAIKETALMQVSIVCRMMDRQRIKADSTLRSSQAVPHPSTNRALCRLTSEVRRDPVHSTWYGRQQLSIYRVSAHITD